MVSYELQITDSVLGVQDCCISHQDHMGFFWLEIGGRIILGFLVHMNFCVNMIPGMVCVNPASNPIKISHFYRLKKGHKDHLIPLVRFIWGDRLLSNFPTWNNNRGGMGWVCTSGKASFFLSFLYQALLLICCHSISLFFDWCFTLSCH